MSKAYHGGVFAKVLDEYADPQMRTAIIKLRNFNASQENAARLTILAHLYSGCRSPDTLKSLKHEVSKAATDYCDSCESELRDDRNRVAWFFRKSWHLYRSGFISRAMLKTVFEFDGGHVLYEIVCPLTLAVRLKQTHNNNLETFLADPSVTWYQEAASATGLEGWNKHSD
jgi:hypothetical protein